jgi:hypothetical protein
MRWARLGWCGVVLGCWACGESAANEPVAATAVAGNSGQAGGGGAGGFKANEGGAGAGAGGSSGGAVGVGMCSGSTNQKGGSRLKSQFAITAEGDRAWQTLWDTKLNQACNFNPAADGKMRCIPSNWNDSTEVFSDAACTQALYTRMQSGPCTSADYIMRVGIQGSCDAPTGYSFYALGAPATPAIIYQMTGSDCVPAPALSEPLYTKGAEVPAATFMEGTNMVFDAVSRIHPRGLVAADGTRLVQGWLDTQVDQDCYFEPATDGKKHCLPHGAYMSGYADAACSLPVVTAVAGCDQKIPNYALQSPDYECTAVPYRVYQRAEAYVGAPFQGGAESCIADTVAPGGGLYRTTPVGPELFQTVIDTIDESDPGRLKPLYYDAGADGCWFQNFWDSELMTPCSFDEATDAKQRCLPTTKLKVQRYFSDAECKVRVALSAIDECTPALLPAYSTNLAPHECARRSEVWKVGEPVLKAELPPLWTDYTGTCMAATPKEEKFLRLTLVDPGQFMAGELQLE